MAEERRIDPAHGAIRGLLRVVGPLLIVVGLGFLVVGIGSFFAAFGGSGPPRQFWCAFVGMALLAAGVALTKFGFMGAVARYTAGEIAPVGKDTFNYLAEGTEDGVRTVARAVGEGLGVGADAAGPAVRCHKCNELNDSDANYCDECGAPLLKSKPCPACKELNDPDARFCDACGHTFE